MAARKNVSTPSFTENKVIQLRPQIPPNKNRHKHKIRLLYPVLFLSGGILLLVLAAFNTELLGYEAYILACFTCLNAAVALADNNSYSDNNENEK